MTVELLLFAAETGAVDFDELLSESQREWQYWSDDYRLVKFAADDDPIRDAQAVGWIRRGDDTWRIWDQAGYEVALPGGYYERIEAPDVDAR